MSNATDNPKIQVLKAGGSGVFTNYIYKAIPLAFDESMSYYETLAGLRDYLEETVIPTVNNNAEAVAELQSLYEELNEYVDDYFKNLDVQEEINNKLDDLVEDGTLTRLIGEYVQPLIDEQNQEISNFKSQVNNQIAQQNAQIQAVESGSPLVASNVSEMTDTTRVYVNTTDGNWYYYNGSAWTVGGVYQTAVGYDLLKFSLEDIQEQIGEVIPITNELNKDDPLEGACRGDVGETINFGTQNYYHRKVYDVIPGELYNVTTFKNVSTMTTIWFIDENDIIIEKYKDNIEITEGSVVEIKRVIVPQNATKMWLVCYGPLGYWTTYFKANKITGYNDLQEQVDELKNDLNTLENIQQKIFVVDKNGYGDFTTLKEGIETATQYWGSTLYVNDGDYDLINEFGSNYLENNTSDSGLKLRNNIHVIFSSGAKVLCNYTGNNTYIHEHFSVFNSLTEWISSTKNKQGFILENANIEASNIRYVVHDEHGGSNIPYRNIYKNCKMKIDNSLNPLNRFSQCIGGGLGKHGEIIIENSIFDSEEIPQYENLPVPAVSYHNNSFSGGNVDDLSNIVVTGNVFLGTRNTFEAGCIGNSTLVTKCLVTNNSCKAVPYVKNTQIGNMEIIGFNNIIETSTP